jgi:hypothetical protein
MDESIGGTPGKKSWKYFPKAILARAIGATNPAKRVIIPAIVPIAG